MRCLVTGGAGFLGSALCRALLGAGHDVRVLDNFSTGKRENLASLDVDIQEGDVAVPVTAGKACEGIDVVMHLAAEASVMRALRHPLHAHRTNTTGTLVMLDAAKRADVSRFVFVSTCAVYGHSTPPCSEQSRAQPLAPYAASKLGAEAYVRAAWEAERYPTTVLRPFNIYGPGQDPNGEYAAVIPKFIQLLRAENTLTIFGNGKQTRDFVFVEDTVAGVLATMVSDAALGRVVNLASGKGTSLLELTSTLAAVSGKEPILNHAEARAGEVEHSHGATEQANELLGWQAKISLREGLQRLWDQGA